MIDSITLYINREYLPKRYLNEVTRRLQTYSIREEDNVKLSYWGKIDNLRVKATEAYLMIEGSLPKYYYGNNQINPTYECFNNSLIKLEDHLKLKLNNAVVQSIEAGINIELNSPVYLYLESFDELKRFQKLEYPNGFLFNQENKSVKFYDKILECRKKNAPIIGSLFQKNVLRIEMKVSRKLNLFLKQPTATLAVVKSKEVYNFLVDQLFYYYMSISRKAVIGLEPHLSSMKKLNDYLLLRGIDALGGKGELLCRINSASKAKLIDCYLASKLREKIRSIATDEAVEKANLAAELDEKMGWAALLGRADF